MEPEKEFKLVTSFSILYILVVGAIGFLFNNKELFLNSVVFIGIILFIQIYHKKLHLAVHTLGALSVFAILHTLGVFVNIGGTRLYDILLFNIIKYDNITHSAGAILAVMIVYSLLRPHLDLRTKHRPLAFSLILVVLALGIGAINEIVEFTSILIGFATPAAIGDYFNNATDLVVNLIGALIGVLIVHPYHKSALEEIKNLESKIRTR